MATFVVKRVGLANCQGLKANGWPEAAQTHFQPRTAGKTRGLGLCISGATVAGNYTRAPSTVGLQAVSGFPTDAALGHAKRRINESEQKVNGLVVLFPLAMPLNARSKMPTSRVAIPRGP